MADDAPISTCGRFFPPLSALYKKAVPRPRVRQALLLSTHPDTLAAECMRAAPLRGLQGARWYKSMQARVSPPERLGFFPGTLHVVCACQAEVSARADNAGILAGASLDALQDGVTLFARDANAPKDKPGVAVCVLWTEARRDGLTAWASLAPCA